MDCILPNRGFLTLTSINLQQCKPAKDCTAKRIHMKLLISESNTRSGIKGKSACALFTFLLKRGAYAVIMQGSHLSFQLLRI